MSIYFFKVFLLHSYKYDMMRFVYRILSIIQYFKLAADNGNAEAMTSYGFMIEKWIGTSVNKEEEAKYYKIAADRGNVEAMLSFSIYIGNGIGIFKIL
mgnify:CR=1 FL=1